MKEREHPNNFKKNALKAVGASTLILGLAVGIASHEQSGCVGKIEQDGQHRRIIACATEEGRVAVELPEGGQILLPEGVCRLTQIWSPQNSDTKINFFRYLDEGYSFQIGQLDLETHEFSDYQTYQIPQSVYYPTQRLPRSAYCLE